MASFGAAYTDPKVLEKKCDEYFDNTREEDLTRSGLALHLGVARCTLDNYRKGSMGEEIQAVVERAYTRIEYGLELHLRHCKGNPAGTSFALKNVAGWRNNNDVEVKASGFEIVCNVPRPEQK